jgi:hypothetical protein
VAANTWAASGSLAVEGNWHPTPQYRCEAMPACPRSSRSWTARGDYFSRQRRPDDGSPCPDPGDTLSWRPGPQLPQAGASSAQGHDGLAANDQLRSVATLPPRYETRPLCDDSLAPRRGLCR